MLDERRIRLKASEAKMCACDGARNCQKRLPNCLSLPQLPMILERFRPTRLGGGRINCRAAVCRECGPNAAEWNLCRNMTGSTRLISITGSGSVPGAGG